MLSIDDDRKVLIESDPAVSVGTRSSELVPHAVRAWGPRVSPDRRSVEVFIDRPNAQRCVEDLQDNGRIAACFVHIQTLRSLQLKGRCVEIGDPAAEDWTWIEQHRAAFTNAAASLGFLPALIRNLWSTQVIKLRFVVEEFFDQTPGPNAGKAILE
jgi:hypothetical protein